MPRKTTVLAGLMFVAGCATAPPPPPPVEAPPPVVISDQSESVAEPVPEATPEPQGPQKPRQSDTGRFRVGVVSAESPGAAEPWVSKLQAAGYRTEVLPVEIEGKTWHRVLLPGYANLEDARAAIPFVEQEFGVQGVWVTSRRRAPAPGAPAEAPAAAPAAEPQPMN